MIPRRFRALLPVFAGLVCLVSATAAGTTASRGQEGPRLAITLPEGLQVAKGEPLAIEIEYHNIPSGAGVILWLVRNAGWDTRVRFFGSSGGLLIYPPRAIAGDGSFSFTWNGRRVCTAPSDIPGWCRDDVEIGRHHLEARVLNRADDPFPMGAPSPGSALAIARSGPFQIVGDPDLKPLQQLLKARVNRHVTPTAAPPYGPSWSVVDATIEVLEPVRIDADGYCAVFELHLPFAGALRACAPLDLISTAGFLVPEEVTISGDWTYAPGVLPFGEALSAALRLAAVPYVHRVDIYQPAVLPLIERPCRTYAECFPADSGSSTSLHAGVTTWRYSADGRYWVFVLYEVKGGGPAGLPDDFSDGVLVRVDDDGTACVVETVPYKSEFAIDPREDPIVCP